MNEDELLKTIVQQNLVFAQRLDQTNIRIDATLERMEKQGGRIEQQGQKITDLKEQLNIIIQMLQELPEAVKEKIGFAK